MKYIKDIVTLKLDHDKCVGCGMCTLVCPHGIFEIAKGKASIKSTESCIECGACSMNCPVDAISVNVGVG